MYGLDLLDFFRGRHTWRKLLALLEHLPASSAYAEALAQDEEYAQQILAADDTHNKRHHPSLSQWTAEVDLLAGIFDRLGDVIAATIAGSGGKPPEARPAPRPQTAIDRLRRNTRYNRHLQLVQEFTQASAHDTATGGET